MTDRELAGRFILVAEDEFHIAMEIERALVQAAAVVLGPASTLAKTLNLIDSTAHIDGAILDINLRGEMIFPAADRLAQRHVPFVISTGYDASIIPARFNGNPRCEKPIRADVLRSVLTSLIISSRPAPR
jgi:DNA-binding response OmpR family regulator